MAKRALIVDDSRTAQVRLRKMLEKFSLEVDTVMSAEEALGYLSYRQPAVVFLDHHMEGMDGLEALKIIKSNPSTALIPVIMYTSEQGDVYVGQARALGAIDILGKEVMKHASLEKVLSGLGIRATTSEDSTAVATEEPETQVPQTAALVEDDPSLRPSYNVYDADDEDSAISTDGASPELTRVQRQISRLFEIHITKVRQEIEDNSKFLFRRLSRELNDRPRPSRSKPAAATPVETEETIPYLPDSGQEKSGLPIWLLSLVLIGIGYLGFQQYIAHNRQDLLKEELAGLKDQSRAQQDLVTRLFAKASETTETRVGEKASADKRVLLDALSWAVNADTQVAFGELALNDQRIYMVGELLGLLKAADFNGIVFIDVHMGNFCVVEDPSGRYMLPEPESNLEECMFLASRMPEILIGEQASIGFLNYLQSAPILAEGNIEIELSSQDYSEPRYSYPPTTSAVSAGDWNAVAQKNNRISVTFATN